jgi:hypothetical protein
LEAVVGGGFVGVGFVAEGDDRENFERFGDLEELAHVLGGVGAVGGGAVVEVTPAAT